jgi:hypothetical protein
MESSKFSPSSLSDMKTDDVKNSYCPKVTSTIEEKNLSTLFNLMRVGKILSFTASLLNFLQKYQFEHRDCSHISSHKYAKNSLAKNYKSSNSQ